MINQLLLLGTVVVTSVLETPVLTRIERRYQNLFRQVYFALMNSTEGDYEHFILYFYSLANAELPSNVIDRYLRPYITQINCLAFSTNIVTINATIVKIRCKG